MAFFSRLGNLARGAIAAHNNPAAPLEDAALERELAAQERAAQERAARRPTPRRAAAEPPPPVEDPRPPLELNPDGSVKRTL